VSDPDALPERFAFDWLGLREPADHRARPARTADILSAWCRTRVANDAEGSKGTAPLRVVDLGAGTGSNLRWLAPRLPGPQAWTLLDHDATLLDRLVPPNVGRPGWAPELTPRVAPLAGASDGGLSPETARAVASADVVTASALLDLLSDDLVAALVEATAAAGAAALFALSYDGAITWSPPDPGDALVREAVNAHQRRDKGTGPALGPRAGPAVRAMFERAGYVTQVEPSPWRLGSDDAPLARALLDGWADAAAEERPDEAESIREWARRRREALGGEPFTLTVGHVDVVAVPS
jgi:hypothetical protein